MLAGTLVLAGLVVSSCKKLPSTEDYFPSVTLTDGTMGSDGGILSFPRLDVLVSGPTEGESLNLTVSIPGTATRSFSFSTGNISSLTLDFLPFKHKSQREAELSVIIRRTHDGAVLYNKTHQLRFQEQVSD